MSPHRNVTLLSKLFTGCTSDQECVRSGLLVLDFEDGGCIRSPSFRIDDLAVDIGMKLKMTPFLRCHQLTAEETQQIAALRIHVERQIQSIEYYHIFDHPIPISLVPLANRTWVICATLSHWHSPVMQESETRYLQCASQLCTSQSCLFIHCTIDNMQ